MEDLEFDTGECSLSIGRCKSRITGIIGIVGTSIIFIGTMLSLYFYPGYNILGQFVSDLGKISIYSQAVIFNGAMIFGNAILVVFNIAICGLIGDRKYGIPAVLSGIVASYGGILIGNCPADVDPDGHIVGVFLTIIFIVPSMAFYSLAILNAKRGYTPKYIAIGTFIGFCFAIFYLGMAIQENFFDPASLAATFPPVYIPTIIEWFSVYCPFVFIMILSIYHLT